METPPLNQFLSPPVHPLLPFSLLSFFLSFFLHVVYILFFYLLSFYYFFGNQRIMFLFFCLYLSFLFLSLCMNLSVYLSVFLSLSVYLSQNFFTPLVFLILQSFYFVSCINNLTEKYLLVRTSIHATIISIKKIYHLTK